MPIYGGFNTRHYTSVHGFLLQAVSCQVYRVNYYLTLIEAPHPHIHGNTEMLKGAVINTVHHHAHSHTITKQAL